MTNKTFCGEYCGNQYHEHLIRHSKHTIYFYSIVDNNDENNICIPVEEAFDIFFDLYNEGHVMASVKLAELIMKRNDLYSEYNDELFRILRFACDHGARYAYYLYSEVAHSTGYFLSNSAKCNIFIINDIYISFPNVF